MSLNNQSPMTLTQDSPPVNIPVGDIQFFDNFIPTLTAADYRIIVTQEVVDAATNQALTAPYVAQQYFTVQAPRFTLNPATVYSVFPPPNALGDFSRVLPHLVLSDRALPWERTLNSPDGTNNQQPWLALLLLDEDEIIAPSPPGGVSSTGAQTLPLSQVVNLPLSNGILGPQGLTLDANLTPPTMQCLAIDLAPATFLALAPQWRELPFLAHTREVNTGNKEILGMNAEGWFSVVIANRTVLAAPPASPPAVSGARNIAHLVSLEGLENFLPNDTHQNPIPDGINVVRLVSLASWSFVCASAGLNFRDLMQNLNVGMLQLPVTEAAPPLLEPAALAPTALIEGYVPLNYTTLPGEQTVAWYRGPFLPTPAQRVERPPFGSADAAKIYDPQTGLFDLSYAVAWQIGRLLALADKQFSTALLNWQREVNYLIDLLLERQRQAARFGRMLALSASDLDNQSMRHAVARYLQTDFADRVLAADGTRAPLLSARRDPTGIRSLHAALPGLLSESEIETALSGGTDPAHTLRRKLARP